MARMYSRKKGKSKSVKPSKKPNLSWLSYKDKEVELLVTKIAKEGKSPSEIGIFLRDNYGIPSVKNVTKKSITKILAQKKLLNELPEDLMSLIKRTVILRKHLKSNHKDNTAVRGLTLTESKIKRLVKFCKKDKKIPMDWKYDPEKIKFLVE